MGMGRPMPGHARVAGGMMGQDQLQLIDDLKGGAYEHRCLRYLW
jgi:hypothetical protein